jgi:hypothetical protein
VLEGKVLPRFNASSREDILDVARLAQRYGFRPGDRRMRRRLDRRGRARSRRRYAVVTPRDRRDKEEQLVRAGGSSIENAAKLHAAGVQICVIPSSVGVDLGGIAGRDILHLTIEADFAVRGGLSEQAALESITIVPARILGVSHRVGTLEVGKDCDLIVTDGDVLHYQTLVQYTVVEGKQVYDKSQELYFAHIRPRPTAAVAPEERHDTGEHVEEKKEDAKAAEEGEKKPTKRRSPTSTSRRTAERSPFRPTTTRPAGRVVLVSSASFGTDSIAAARCPTQPRFAPLVRGLSESALPRVSSGASFRGPSSSVPEDQLS